MARQGQPIDKNEDTGKGSKINHCFDRVGRYSAFISAVTTAAFLVCMTLLITVDVIGRGIFSKPTHIADAASGYMLVGITFLGLACAELAGKHVTVNMLTRRLPPRRREQLEVAVLIVTLVFSIWFTWILFGVTKMNYHVTSVDALHIRVWITYSVGPIGVGMFAVVLLTKVIQKLRGLVNPKDIK